MALALALSPWQFIPWPWQFTHLQVRPEAACLLANSPNSLAGVLLDDLHGLGLLGLLCSLSAPVAGLQDIILERDIDRVSIGETCAANKSKLDPQSPLEYNA